MAPAPLETEHSRLIDPVRVGPTQYSTVVGRGDQGGPL